MESNQEPKKVQKGDQIAWEVGLLGQWMQFERGRSEDKYVCKRERLLHEFKIVKFENDSLVYSEGQMNDQNFYIIISGKIEQRSECSIISQSLSDGDYFGEKELIFTCPRIANIYCLKETYVLKLDRDTFKACFLEYFISYHPILAQIKHPRSIISELLKNVQMVQLAYLLQPVTYKQGTILDLTNYFYVLGKGDVKIIQSLQYGNQTIQRNSLLKPSEVFGYENIIQSDIQMTLVPPGDSSEIIIISDNIIEKQKWIPPSGKHPNSSNQNTDKVNINESLLLKKGYVQNIMQAHVISESAVVYPIPYFLFLEMLAMRYGLQESKELILKFILQKFQISTPNLMRKRNSMLDTTDQTTFLKKEKQLHSHSQNKYTRLSSENKKSSLVQENSQNKVNDNLKHEKNKRQTQISVKDISKVRVSQDIQVPHRAFNRISLSVNNSFQKKKHFIKPVLYLCHTNQLSSLEIMDTQFQPPKVFQNQKYIGPLAKQLESSQKIKLPHTHSSFQTYQLDSDRQLKQDYLELNSINEIRLGINVQQKMKDYFEQENLAKHLTSDQPERIQRSSLNQINTLDIGSLSNRLMIKSQQQNVNERNSTIQQKSKSNRSTKRNYREDTIFNGQLTNCNKYETDNKNINCINSNEPQHANLQSSSNLIQLHRSRNDSQQFEHFISKDHQSNHSIVKQYAPKSQSESEDLNKSNQFIHSTLYKQQTIIPLSQIENIPSSLSVCKADSRKIMITSSKLTNRIPSPPRLELKSNNLPTQQPKTLEKLNYQQLEEETTLGPSQGNAIKTNKESQKLKKMQLAQRDPWWRILELEKLPVKLNMTGIGEPSYKFDHLVKQLQFKRQKFKEKHEVEQTEKRGKQARGSHNKSLNIVLHIVKEYFDNIEENSGFPIPCAPLKPTIQDNSSTNQSNNKQSLAYTNKYSNNSFIHLNRSNIKINHPQRSRSITPQLFIQQNLNSVSLHPPNIQKYSKNPYQIRQISPLTTDNHISHNN